MSELSHVDKSGSARMVDVGGKVVSARTAIAEGQVHMRTETLALVRQGALEKGDVLAVAQVAGIQAAKRTAELIPFCHPLALEHLALEFELDDALPGIRIRASVSATAKTGVEMEALTAVSVAALTIYDMVKAAEKGMRIEGIRLLAKTGGKEGEWNAE